jgi:hypothetical protein
VISFTKVHLTPLARRRISLQIGHLQLVDLTTGGFMRSISHAVIAA